MGREAPPLRTSRGGATVGWVSAIIAVIVIVWVVAALWTPRRHVAQSVHFPSTTPPVQVTPVPPATSGTPAPPSPTTGATGSRTDPPSPNP